NYELKAENDFYFTISLSHQFIIMKKWINKYLSDDDLSTIKEKIAEVEKSTCGEIRLSIRHKRALAERLRKPHELAVKDFERLGMVNNKSKTGVLIFIIFGERFYDILADEGIHPKIHLSTWNGLELKLKEEFRKENYVEGILNVIKTMGGILKEEFPRKDGDINELEDDVIVN